MKNVFLCFFCGIFWAFFIAGCATVDEKMVRNSLGYDVNSQRDDELFSSSRPEWVKNFETYRVAEEKKSGNNLCYFMGKSTPPLRELEKNGTNWSQAAAAEEALADAMRQIAQNIELKIKHDYSERISEIQKQKGTEQGGITIAQLKQYQAEDITLLQTEASSSANFGGLRTVLQFSELWEKQTKQGKTLAYHSWIAYSVPQDAIDNARQEIAAERQKALDEKARRESLEKKEENYFVVLSGQYERIIEDLKSIDFSGDEKQFSGKYNELLNIYAQMQALSLLKNRDDEVGRRYSDLLNNSVNELREYNPSNRQLRIIENLQRLAENLQIQIEKKNTRIDENEAYIEKLLTRKLDYSLQTQTIIVSYPQRPNETRIASANIFAANDMVSNRDFISFANINGINNLLRGEQGLEAPAVLVTWNDAARYCNWLSRLYGYTPYYTESKGQITGYNRRNNGYRLPEHNEIIAIIEAHPRIVNEAEFTQTAIWSSESTSSGHKCYKLSAGTGSFAGRLSDQSIDNELSDMETGFRIVRNAE